MVDKNNIFQESSDGRILTTRFIAAKVDEFPASLNIDKLLITSVEELCTSFPFPEKDRLNRLRERILVSKEFDEAQRVTKLHIAAGDGNAEEVRLLAARFDESVNSISADGFTPLHFAVVGNHLNVIEVLLSEHANPCIGSSHNYNPIRTACHLGNFEALQLMMKNKGSYVNKDDRLLLLAAHSGNTDVFDLVIDGKKEIGDFKAVEMAVKRGHLHLLNRMDEKHGLTLNSRFATRDKANLIHRNVTALHLAAQKGYTEIVKLLISKGVPVNSKTDKGVFPLHLAAQHKHFDVVAELLLHEANVNEPDFRGITPLHCGVASGVVPLVDILLKYNANVNAITNYGYSPIHISTMLGLVDVTQLLMLHKANIHAMTSDKENLVCCAVKSGELDILQLILDAGVNPNLADIQGAVPLYHAAFTKSSSGPLAKLLLDHKVIIGKDHKKWSPLHSAAYYGATGMVNALLPTSDANKKSPDGYLPIHLAAMKNHYEIVEILGSEVDNVDVRDENLWMPLDYAAYNGNPDMVRYFLKFSSVVEAVQLCKIESVYPIHLAVRNGYLEVVKILIEYGANVLALMRGNVSALHIAARFCDLDMVKFLVKSGCYFDARTTHKTILKPSEAAEINTNTGVKDYLVDAENFFKYVMDKDLKSVAKMLTKTNLSLANCVSETLGAAVVQAALNGDVQMIKVMLRASANPNMCSFGNRRAIHVAAEHNNYEIVLYLLMKGACYNPQMTDTKTPLGLALGKRCNNIAQLLIEIESNFEKIAQNTPDALSNLTAIQSSDPLKFLAFLHATNGQGCKLLKYSALLKRTNITDELKTLLVHSLAIQSPLDSAPGTTASLSETGAISSRSSPASSHRATATPRAATRQSDSEVNAQSSAAKESIPHAAFKELKLRRGRQLVQTRDSYTMDSDARVPELPFHAEFPATQNCAEQEITASEKRNLRRSTNPRLNKCLNVKK